MTTKQKNDEIRKFLRENGYRPRENKDINNYIKQLRDRLRKQGNDLFIEESNDKLNIYIGKKKSIIKRTKAIYVKVTNEEMNKYKELASRLGVDLSKLVRALLDEECSK